MLTCSSWLWTQAACSFYIEPGLTAPVGAAAPCGCTPSVEAETSEVRVSVDDVTGIFSPVVVPSVGLMLISDFGRKPVRVPLRMSLRPARRVGAVRSWSTPAEDKSSIVNSYSDGRSCGSLIFDKTMAILICETWFQMHYSLVWWPGKVCCLIQSVSPAESSNLMYWAGSTVILMCYGPLWLLYMLYTSEKKLNEYFSLSVIG